MSTIEGADQVNSAAELISGTHVHLLVREFTPLSRDLARAEEDLAHDEVNELILNAVGAVEVDRIAVR